MNNVYGTKRPANITPDDVEIFYFYRPNRSEEDNTFGTVFKPLDAYSVLSKAKVSKALKIKIPEWKHSLEKFIKNSRFNPL